MTHRFLYIIVLMASLLALGQTAKASDSHHLKWLEPAQSQLIFDASSAELDLDNDSSNIAYQRPQHSDYYDSLGFLPSDPQISPFTLEEIHPRAPPFVFI